MESKQKNIDADAKKQSFLSSTTTTMNIYVDENINKNEEQQKEHQRRTLKPANLNVFTDASNNKFETQQEQQQDQRQMLKKKKNGYYHKKYKNKNKNHNGNNNNKVHIPYHRDHHHRQPSNNQGYLSYEEGVVASMQANQYYSTGFQPPSPGCIPGCQHLFHVPHPQQEHHSYVDDDNGYNCVAASHFSPHPPPCSWMDVLDNNTVVAGVVFINGGEIKIMNIPPTVGAGLVGELLVQKENHKASSHHHHDPNGNANTNAEEERPLQGNADVSGFGDQGIAPSSLLAPADYQGSPFVQRGSAPSHLSSNPHHRPNNHADYHRHYAMHAPTLNPQQPHNGCGSLLPSDNNYGVHMVQPTSHYQMMPQQHQNPPLYHPQQARAQQIAVTPRTMPRHTHPRRFHADEEHTGPSPDEAVEGEICIDHKGRGDEHDHPSSNKNNMEATHNREGINQGVVAEGGNHPQVHHHNHNAVTPHRGAFGGNGERDPRRISLSPVSPLPQTLDTASDGKM